MLQGSQVWKTGKSDIPPPSCSRGQARPLAFLKYFRDCVRKPASRRNQMQHREQSRGARRPGRRAHHAASDHCGHVSVYCVARCSGASVWRPPARREGETMIACKSYLPGGGCVPKLIGIRRGGDCKVEKKKKQTQAVVWRRHRY